MIDIPIMATKLSNPNCEYAFWLAEKAVGERFSSLLHNSIALELIAMLDAREFKR